jgi:hypothetical protein
MFRCVNSCALDRRLATVGTAGQTTRFARMLDLFRA